MPITLLLTPRIFRPFYGPVVYLSFREILAWMLAKCLRKPRSKTAAAACLLRLAGLKRLEKVVKFTDFLNKRNVLSFCGPLKSPNGFLWKKTTTTSSAFALATLLASKPIDGSMYSLGWIRARKLYKIASAIVRYGAHWARRLTQYLAYYSGIDEYGVPINYFLQTCFKEKPKRTLNFKCKYLHSYILCKSVIPICMYVNHFTTFPG